MHTTTSWLVVGRSETVDSREVVGSRLPWEEFFQRCYCTVREELMNWVSKTFDGNEEQAPLYTL